MALTKISTAMWNSVPHHDTHDFNVDDVLYVDVSANNVGIGTTNPDVQLHVKSSGTTFSQIRVEAGADGHDSSVAYSQAGIIKGISGYDDSTDTVAIKYGTFSGSGIDISSSGNIGIGTTSPVRKLDVDSGTSSDIVRFGNNSGSMTFGQTTSLTSLDLATSNAYRIRQGASIPFYINTSGNVGIGTVSPSQKLTVEGDIELGTGGYIYGDTTNPRVYLNNANGAFLMYGGSSYIGVGSSNVNASVNIHAPAFYDSDNTAYYVDPASTSKFSKVMTATSGATPRYDTAFYVLQAQHWYGDTSTQIMYIGESGNDVYVRGQMAIGGTAIQPGYALTMSGSIYMNANSIDYVNQLHFNDNVRFYDDGNDQYLNFKWGDSGAGGIKFIDGDGTLHGYVFGDGAGGFGLLDKDGQWALYTNGASELQLRSNDNIEFVVYNSYTYSPGSSRAPIFYDSDDTNYYVDPTGNSKLKYIASGDAGVLASGYGITSYDSKRYLIGFRNSSATGTNYPWLVHDDISGGDGLIVHFNGVGDKMTLNELGSLTATGDMRAPIFYDSDNTGYYVDPASTSVLNTVSHNGLSMTNGTAIDQLKTYTVSLQLSTSWIDTGINGSDLSSGVYIFSLLASDSAVGGGHYSETYAGIISWYSDNTNSNVTDEIIISSRSGHAPNAGDIQLRIKRTYGADPNDLILQIKANYTASGSSNYTFKFRRMI